MHRPRLVPVVRVSAVRPDQPKQLAGDCQCTQQQQGEMEGPTEGLFRAFSRASGSISHAELVLLARGWVGPRRLPHGQCAVCPQGPKNCFGWHDQTGRPLYSDAAGQRYRRRRWTTWRP